MRGDEFTSVGGCYIVLMIIISRLTFLGCYKEWLIHTSFLKSQLCY